MRSKALSMVLALAVLLLVGSTVSAQEVVHFKSGNVMAAAGHTVEDGMIHVQLGPNSRISFPLGMVDRIVKGDDVVEFNAEDAPITTRWSRARVRSTRWSTLASAVGRSRIRSGAPGKATF